ncbi:uncharacterized protein LOC121734270 [Aricia agestis]|uniref:uncharacterized protein LOC121734270 n=1 Tax=Aricia agestis TaxID=91739 RepID=UPI001C203348|nr:uncharacterized protein LOC121734270 [Aricia agestis]
MFKCSQCDVEFIDGPQCSTCKNRFDFRCSGITESGYRKLGERKNNWKCISCKNKGSTQTLAPVGGGSSPSSPVPSDLDGVLKDIRRISIQMAALPELVSDIKSIKSDLADLASLRSELVELKTSVDFIHQMFESTTDKICKLEKEVQGLLKTNDEVKSLQQRIDGLERTVRENEQRSRLNNIEIKGLPMTSSENLFTIVTNIGKFIKCPISKEQINYVARIPSSNDKLPKPVIVALHNRYLKEDFVAAAKKCNLSPGDLNLHGTGRIFINDHLTLDNKLLLNKTKLLAKEKGYAFTWVKGCKIFLRKNPESRVILVRSELDLKKLE